MLARRPWLAFLLMPAFVAPTRSDEPPPPSPPASATSKPRIDFDRQIRPILSDRCFKCHGPDADERQADLRLDMRAEALKPAESGKPAIVPGKAEESTLVKRVFSTRKSFRMPPPDSNKTLSDAERELLKAWIAQGAEYRTHWSFTPPSRPNLPTVRAPSWPRNPIDAFVLARLEADALTPAPEADRTTLIRRLALDLTGLPPSPADVDRFLADTNPNAYEALVDRLLGSPHYGERLAVDWLDAARYADTHGFHIDSGRDMTRWRAWVIDAFNRNLPFDRFTVEQIAGDLLPDATTDQKVASGFNRNHMINFEGGAIPEEYLTAYIVDRVNTTGTVWLGLTIACAQCHDHKFDPIAQKDYYGFYAFFNNVPEQGLDGSKGNASPVLKVPTAEQRREIDRIAAELARLESELSAPNAEADAAQAEWERTAALSPVAWTTLDPAEFASRNGATLTKLDDKSIVASGTNPAVETYTVRVRPELETITALRLDVLADDRFPARGPGRSANGNFVLTEVRVTAGAPGSETPVKLKAASADFSQESFAVARAIDPRPRTGWAVLPQVGKPHAAVFELETPIRRGDETRLTVTLDCRSQFAQHQPGRFRLSATDAKEPHGGKTLPPAVREILAVAPEARSEPQQAELRRHYRSAVAPSFQPQRNAIADLRKARETLEKSIPTTMVMQELPQPRETFMLVRGQYDRKGDKVAAAVPSFLPPLPPGAPPNRLGLARWLVDPAHPLTARVAVNRYWQMLFGTGLVKTSEDFGSQGEPPSHPQLLDWLAAEFVNPAPESSLRHPWDVKGLVRLIVTSAAYRQSSAVTPDRLAKDPENRLLSRGPRFRLQAEFVRDQALAIGGLLRDSIGGKSVSPYQPPGLWEELMSRDDGANWTAQKYVQDHGPDLYRRSMYTFWKRTSPPPSLATFDAPDRETCTVRRARTNTPLQALVLMNDPTYVEAARKLGERLLREAAATDDRITLAFRLATARRPSPEELATVRRLLDEELAAFRGDPDAARKLLSVGESPRDESLDPAELAAWSVVASAVLNLDETVTKG